MLDELIISASNSSASAKISICPTLLQRGYGETKTPIEDIAALLGHDLREHPMNAQYAHVDLDALRKHVNKLVPKPAVKTDTSAVVELQKVAG